MQPHNAELCDMEQQYAIISQQRGNKTLSRIYVQHLLWAQFHVYHHNTKLPPGFKRSSLLSLTCKGPNSSCISGTLHSYCWFYQMGPPLLLASGPCLSFPSESPDWSKFIIVWAQEEINKSLRRKLAFQTAWVQCNTCMHTNMPLFFLFLALSGSV